MPLSELFRQPPNRSTPTFEVALFFNPEQRTAINIVPGLVGIILTMTMIMFTSAAIVRERERGNMEMLINTPVRPIELMMGKIIPYIFIGLVQTVIILGLGHLLFQRAPGRTHARSLRRHAALHRREPVARPGAVDHRPEPAAGDPDDRLRAAAVDPAVRLHVPLRGHAADRPVHCRGLSRRPISCA
jgi:hypothetical protein